MNAQFPDANGILLYKSTDGGRTYPIATAVALRRTSDEAPLTPDVNGNPIRIRDGPKVKVDKRGGVRPTVYVVFAASSDSGCCAAVSTSTDGGLSFRTQITSVNGYPALGPNGELYLLGATFGAWISTDLWISTDQGNTFTGKTAFSIAPSANFGYGNWPWQGFAVDANPNSPYKGNLYSAYGDGSLDDGDVFFRRSTDGGNTWSAYAKVNDDRPNNFCNGSTPQYLVNLNVAPNGRIDIVWFDRRNDPYSSDCNPNTDDPAHPHYADLYYAYSLDGGETFSPNIRISQESTFSGGDYIWVGSGRDQAFPWWTQWLPNAEPYQSQGRIAYTATISHANQPPAVNAGPDQTIVLPNMIALNGIVTDEGLPNPPGAVTISWSKVSGTGTVTFGSPSTATTTATFSQPDTYLLRLTASDGSLSAYDDIVVTVEAPQPPVISLISDKTVPEGSRLEFRVRADNPNGNLQAQIAATRLPAGAEFIPLGDLNGDGLVNQTDYNLMIQYATGALTPTAEQLSLADLNGDGQINAVDIVILERIAFNHTRVSRFRWTPTVTQAGSYPLTLMVTDANGLSASQTVTITVQETSLALAGTIRDQTGHPVSGVLVRLSGLGRYPDHRSIEVSTDAQGRYVLSELQTTQRIQQAVTTCQQAGVCLPIPAVVRPRQPRMRFMDSHSTLRRPSITVTFDPKNLHDATGVDFTAVSQ